VAPDLHRAEFKDVVRVARRTLGEQEVVGDTIDRVGADLRVEVMHGGEARRGPQRRPLQLVLQRDRVDSRTGHRDLGGGFRDRDGRRQAHLAEVDTRPDQGCAEAAGDQCHGHQRPDQGRSAAMGAAEHRLRGDHVGAASTEMPGARLAHARLAHDGLRRSDRAALHR
jgi:hypothetical protein